MPRHLSRVMVYGPCVGCEQECVGDTTREVGYLDAGEFIRTGYVHPHCDTATRKLP